MHLSNGDGPVAASYVRKPSTRLQASRHESDQIISRILALIELTRLRSEAPLFKDELLKKKKTHHRLACKTHQKHAR